MADIPARLHVLQRLATLLEGVTAPDQNGAPYNLVGKVYRGRTEFGDETALPAISILEAPSPDIGKFAGSNQALNENWLLLIQGWAVNDPLNPCDPAYWLAAAVQQRLALVNAERADGSSRPLDKDWYLLGGLLTKCEVGPSVVRPLEAKTSSRAFFYQPIRVGLAQLVIAPYLSV